MRDQPDKMAPGDRLPIVLATGAGRLSGDSTSEIDEYGNELFYLGRSSNRRLVKKNLKDGVIETFVGDKGSEQMESRYYPEVRDRLGVIPARTDFFNLEGNFVERQLNHTTGSTTVWDETGSRIKFIRPDGREWKYEGARGEERLSSVYYPEKLIPSYVRYARTCFYDLNEKFVAREVNHYNGNTTFRDKTGRVIKFKRPDGLEWNDSVIRDVYNEAEEALLTPPSPRQKLALAKRLELFANNGLLLTLTVDDMSDGLHRRKLDAQLRWIADDESYAGYYFKGERNDPEIVRVAVKQNGDVLRTLDPVFEHNPSLRLVAAETSAHFALVVLTDMKKDLLQYDEKALDSYVRKFRRTAFGRYLFGTEDPELEAYLEAYRSYGDAASALAQFWSTPKNVKLSPDDIELYEQIQLAAEEVLVITEDPKRILVQNERRQAFEDDMQDLMQKRKLRAAAMEATTAAHWDHTLFDDATPSRPSPTGRSSSMVDAVVDGFVKARM